MNATGWVVLGALVILIAAGAIVAANCTDLGMLGTFCSKPVVIK